MSLGRRISLARVRLLFAALTVVLLGVLGGLAIFLQQRLDESRRDREEMVALRVFDELEREASVFLESEEERPPYNNIERSDPSTWAPFVVGYFKSRGSDMSVVAADGQASENRRRILWAIETTKLRERRQEPSGQQERLLTPHEPAPPDPTTPVAPTRKRAAPPPPVQQKSNVQEKQIIQSLNRASVRRKLEQKKAPRPQSSKDSDQFNDYAERF